MDCERNSKSILVLGVSPALSSGGDTTGCERNMLEVWHPMVLGVADRSERMIAENVRHNHAVLIEPCVVIMFVMCRRLERDGMDAGARTDKT